MVYLISLIGLELDQELAGKSRQTKPDPSKSVAEV
jgi:hypothetical protein